MTIKFSKKETPKLNYANILFQPANDKLKRLFFRSLYTIKKILLNFVPTNRNHNEQTP